jgi:hypothetical protein
LHKYFIVEQKPLKFTGAYEKIKNHWADFVKYKNSEEAKKRSATNKANAEQKEYHHNMGAAGYKGKRPQWEKLKADLIEKGINPQPLNWVDRARDWFYGHGGTLDLETGQCIYTKEHLQHPSRRFKKQCRK